MIALADIVAATRPLTARFEGCRLHAYPDPLSGGLPWTIGYGCTGDGIDQDTVWTQEQADAALTERLTEVAESLLKALPWWPEMGLPRACVFLDMAYNLGLSGFLQFRNTIAAAKAGNWAAVRLGMLASRWASQVGDRADDLADIICPRVAA